MKARVIEETPYSPNFKKGDIVEIIPGMETDSEGIWNIPGGRLFLCRTKDGYQAYMFPSCLQVLTGEVADSVSEFRKAAALSFASSILANPMWYKNFDGHSNASQFGNAYFKKHVIGNAISYADELIQELGLNKFESQGDTVRMYRPVPGTTIQEAAKETVDMVKQEGSPILLSFNSASILVEPYDTADEVWEQYHKCCNGHWKPSDSQMAALLTAVGDERKDGSDVAKELRTLYYDLKKRKKEDEV